MFLQFVILLIFAHMLADYVFQWQSLVDRKKEEKNGAFVVHVAIVFCLAMVVTFSWFSWIWFILIFLLSVLHLLQDVVKVKLQNKRPKWTFQLEIFDLLLHLFMIITISIVFFQMLSHYELSKLLSSINTDKIIIKIAIYGSALAFIIKGGTSLVRALLDQIGKAPPKHSKMIGFVAQNNSESEGEPGESEYNVGKIIGNLERILLFVFVVLGNYAAIGFVIAAKSVARFKDLEDHNFAEYYLVGTLASTLIAIAAGLCVVFISDLI